MAHAVSRSWKIKSADISNAFLQTELRDDERLYFHPPPGYARPGYILSLRKNLYGLRSAPRTWWLDFGLESLESDPCTFVKRSRSGKLQLMVELHVDDLLASGTDGALNAFFKYLHSLYQLRVYDVTEEYVGIEFQHMDMGAVKLHQRRYTMEQAQRYLPAKVLDQKVTYPMVPDLRLPVATGESENRPEYLSLLGALLFVACNTRPEVAYAVMELSRHARKHTLVHWLAAIRVLHYLVSTADKGLVYRRGQPFEMQVYCDADHAKSAGARSITGWVILLAGTAVAWSSHVQGHGVARYSFEAEYFALSPAVAAAVGILHVLRDLGIVHGSVPVHCDNQHVVVKTVEGRIYGAKGLRHVRLHFGYVYDLLQRGVIAFTHVMGADNVADVFTKALQGSALHRKLTSLGVL